MIETNKIYLESCLETLKRMPDNFLDCVVTSPPYYGLRSYGTEPQIWGGDADCDHQWGESLPFVKQDSRTAEEKAAQGAQVGSNINFNEETTTATSGAFCRCGAWRGELGLEPTFQLYLDHLIEIFREVKRALKPSGSVWVNLGDSYAGSWGNYGGQNRGNGTQRPIKAETLSRPAYDGLAQWRPPTTNQVVKAKSLMNIPHRFFIRMTDELGFIQRNNINWHKLACMPSSAKDRFTVDFESIGFFTKEPKYYFEQQLEPVKEVSLQRVQSGWKSDHPSIGSIDVQEMGSRFANPEGRNMRTTWAINFEASSEEHYASYPTALVARMIVAGCPQFVCNKCGTPRSKIIETKSIPTKREQFGEQPSGNGHQSSTGWVAPERTELGLTDCGCDAGWSGGLIYDPFGGTATTAVVAHNLGRRWICSELQPKYVDISERRLEPILAQGGLF